MAGCVQSFTDARYWKMLTRLQTVVITGGSQGMGRGLGKLLAQKGANVVIVARNEQKLADALKYISVRKPHFAWEKRTALTGYMQSAAKSPQSQRFHSISADVTSSSENIRLIQEVTAWNDGNPPDVVWANAGGAHPYLFIDTDLETQRAQMDLNYWAAAYLAHATLKLWLRPNAEKQDAAAAKAAKPRHLIMTGSVASFAPLTGYVPYTGAKAAMRSMADNLRQEMNLYNGYRLSHPALAPAADVQVHLIAPGTIISPGLDNEESIKHPVTKVLEEGDLKQTEDEVALAAVKGLEAGGFMIATQLLAKLMRGGMLGGSPRNNVFTDTLWSWLASVVWLFVGPDMEGKVFNWGKKNKVDLPGADK